jgi:hypothetical protein
MRDVFRQRETKFRTNPFGCEPLADEAVGREDADALAHERIAVVEWWQVDVLDVVSRGLR